MKKANSLSFLYVVFMLLPYSLTAQSVCTGQWRAPVVNQTFGQGNNTDNWYGPLATYAPGASTSTIFVGTAGPAGGALSDGYSGLVKTPSVGQNGFADHPDHTGDTNGLMFLFNAPSTAGTIFFEYMISDVCPNTILRLSIWILNVNPAPTCEPNYQYPNITLQALDSATGAILGTSQTGNIAKDLTWKQYSIVFNNGNSSSVKLQFVNNSVGNGCGNDFAVDDITVEPCVPIAQLLPKVNTQVCGDGTLFNFNANVVSNPYNPAEYQWQYSTNAGVTWQNQGTPTSSGNYIFNTSTLLPATYWIRYVVGPAGRLSNPFCSAISDTSIVKVSLKVPLPIVNDVKYCLGDPAQPLHATGQNLTWYNEGSNVGNTNAPIPATSATDTVVYYVTQTIDGCESEMATVNVQIATVNGVIYPADSTICLDKPLQLFAAGGSDYHWYDTPDYTTAYSLSCNTCANPDVITGTAGYVYYNVIITSAAGCSDTLSSAIHLLPSPDIRISPSEATIKYGESVQLEATGGEFYTWTPISTLNYSTIAKPLAKPLEPTAYIVTGISDSGCIASDTSYINIDYTNQPFIPTGFSPNGDGKNDLFKVFQLNFSKLIEFRGI